MESNDLDYLVAYRVTTDSEILIRNIDPGKNCDDIIPALGDLDVSQVPLLLNVKEGDSISITEKQHSSSGVEDLFAVGKLDLFGQLVLQVLDDQLGGIKEKYVIEIKN